MCIHTRNRITNDNSWNVHQQNFCSTIIQGTDEHNILDRKITAKLVCTCVTCTTTATMHHCYCLFALYIGRPSVTKPFDSGGLSRLNSVKPNVRYISTVATLALLRVVQMPSEPQTFNGGTMHASARLAMLISPTALSFHWLSMSILTTDWQCSAGMWTAFDAEWKLEIISYNSVQILQTAMTTVHLCSSLTNARLSSSVTY